MSCWRAAISKSEVSADWMMSTSCLAGTWAVITSMSFTGFFQGGVCGFFTSVA